MPNLGAPELLLIVLVVLLLFGGRKLPELARGSGKALRIFKSEVAEEKDELTTQRSTDVVEGEIVDDDPQK
jgi:sec-independent protein translocase protein TatA